GGYKPWALRNGHEYPTSKGRRCILAPKGGIKEINFQTFIIAVNYGNTGVDRILASFNWTWTPSATSSIRLNPTASPAAISFIKSAYPLYKIN
ncbi:hypothetical protein KXD93_30450, partial [Mucilaginibacter sp. BJC16-A38]|uniref:hypothetical protein n=1 Tax=Mucilaginibacter phenanthrenivorans TaxID=1234842 RepID=UPI002157B1B6